jgi:hypothetical protein
MAKPFGFWALKKKSQFPPYLLILAPTRITDRREVILVGKKFVKFYMGCRSKATAILVGIN